MAATIAKAMGHDSNRVKTVHRLGSAAAQVEAATWRTFVEAWVNRDGSGFVCITRDGKLLHHWTFDAEGLTKQQEAEEYAERSGTNEANEDVKDMSDDELRVRKDELERMQRVTKQSTTSGTLPPIKMRTRDKVNAHQGNRK